MAKLLCVSKQQSPLLYPPDGIFVTKISLQSSLILRAFPDFPRKLACLKIMCYIMVSSSIRDCSAAKNSDFVPILGLLAMKISICK